MARYVSEFVGGRLSTGDSIGPALRARVTRKREIVCATMRKVGEGKKKGGESREIERKSGGGCDGERTVAPEG